VGIIDVVRIFSSILVQDDNEIMSDIFGCNEIKFVIPARMGSKGVQFKNRELVPVVVNSLPSSYAKNIILSTDDPVIIGENERLEILIHTRSKPAASDTASMLEVLKEVSYDCNFKDSDTIICLYPTYPTRTFTDIERALKLFLDHGAASLLCKTQVKSHPYMCLRASGEFHGEKLFDHDLYRRQDYPECFRVSHFIVIICVSELHKVNSQLINDDTIFMNINEGVDIDTSDDLNKYRKMNL